MPKPLWTPSAEHRDKANITKFMNWLAARHAKQFSTYDQLYQWSVDQMEDFWLALSEFAGVAFSQSCHTVLDDPKRMPGANWFIGARMNFAQNLLRFRDDRPALIGKSEDRPSRVLSYAELYRDVARLAHPLQDSGVAPGDRVVAYMPNIPETAVAMLAATSLGATWASCAIDMRPSAVLDRLAQIQPKVLFAVDGYKHKGKAFDCLAHVRAIVEGIPSLKRVIVISRGRGRADVGAIANAVHFDRFVSKDTSLEVPFAQLPFDHPLFIMFSSGTTGKPKCLVQGAGGVLINHLNELILHCDLTRQDTHFYITTCSWMMWNWLLSSLAVGSAVLLHDGHPLYPDATAMWKLIEEQRVSIFGTSASYIDYLRGQGMTPAKVCNLSSLRQISQTGSPLSAEGFEYIYRDVKPDLHFNSLSGGTDINGCFAIGNPTIPVHAGQIQAPGLAKRIKAYDEKGKSVLDQQGELVCEAAIPSMPLYFWDDPDGRKYREAYFSTYRGVWRHGDYITIHGDTGGITFLGRSDATLNPSGVRIGTAEIYRQAEQLPEIADSLAVGQAHKGDQRIILFVKLAPGHTFSQQLIDKIKNALRDNASPRHVPAKIIEAPDIPYTMNMKKVETAVANIINGRAVLNRESLINPECLDFYQNVQL